MIDDASVRLGRHVGWGLTLVLVWALLLRLLFAVPGLDDLRFWDERYSLENVEHVLESGRLEPVSGWYPVPSWLPQTALLASVEALLEATGRSPEIVRTANGVTPLGRYLCRALAAIFATAGLALVFLLGRRLFGPAVGLLGTVLLAATGVHLRLSAAFKPDVLLLAMGVAAVIAALQAVRVGGGWRFALAGAAVALAASAKLNGVLYAVLLVVATLLRDSRARERWRGLLIAGVTSVVLFLSLNPWWRLYLEYLERTRFQYLETATGLGETRFGALGRSLAELLSPAFHGPLVGSLALAGLAAVLVTALRRRSQGWAERVTFVVFPLVYLAIFVAATPRAKPNHLLQLLPFTSLAAAWLLVQLGRPLWRGRDTRRGVLLLAGVATLAMIPPTLEVYRTLVPSTSRLAAEALSRRLSPIDLVQVCQRFAAAEDAPPLDVVEYRDRAVVVTPQLVGETECVRLSDAVVSAPGAEGSHQPDGATVVRARPFRSRGPTLTMTVAPFEVAGDRVLTLEALPQGDGTVRLVAPWPAGLESQVVSVVARVPRLFVEGSSLSSDRRALPLFGTRERGARDRLVTARWLAGDEGSLTLELPVGTEPLPDFVRVVVWRR